MINKLKIKYVAAQNFICFKDIKIDFSELGNIVSIRGKNLDVHEIDDGDNHIATNGVGKTSIPEIIVYTIFGKTIKYPKKVGHSDVINNQIGKNLRTEIYIDDLRIVRTRKPDSLHVWESKDGIWNKDTEITVGGMPATQKLLESKIGLSYEAFVNLVIFTDNNSGSFLECDTPTKREIVENLLSLERYRSHFESAKKLRNKVKDDIKQAAWSLETALSAIATSRQRLVAVQQEEVQWKLNKIKELDQLKQKLLAKKTELKASDHGAAIEKFEAVQARIEEAQKEMDGKKAKAALCKEKIAELQQKYSDLQAIVNEYDRNLQVMTLDSDKCQSNINYNKKILQDIEASRCKFCGQTDEQIIENAKKAIQSDSEKLINLTESIQKKTADRVTKAAEKKKSEDLILLGNKNALMFESEAEKLRKEIATLSAIEKPEISVVEKLLKEQIVELNKQIKDKETEVDSPSPFIKIVKSTEGEIAVAEENCEVCKENLNKLNEVLPYYEFWVEGFGDSGIRKYVIQEIIPALNSRIAYWLDFLIDGKISLAFDSELEETIHRNPSDGDPFVYHTLSGGERRRLNLAVSQAFAHIMMLNCGTSPSVIFLDEVTTNIDPMGVQGVYNMILELAKEKQVFVTTHDHDLLDLLSGCETIKLVKKGGFTSIAA